LNARFESWHSILAYFGVDDYKMLEHENSRTAVFNIYENNKYLYITFYLCRSAVLLTKKDTQSS
jgi:hypothetical protein